MSLRPRYLELLSLFFFFLFLNTNPELTRALSVTHFHLKAGVFAVEAVNRPFRVQTKITDLHKTRAALGKCTLIKERCGTFLCKKKPLSKKGKFRILHVGLHFLATQSVFEFLETLFTLNFSVLVFLHVATAKLAVASAHC